jgi:NADH-quinone oxidoreductase subunit N
MTIFICLFQFLFFTNAVLVNFVTYSITDVYTLAIKLLVLLTTILILNASKDALKKHPRHLMEYPVLILMTALFLLILTSAYNFLTVFLAILGFSLNLYVLLLNDAFNQASREAGIKYFYLSTVSSGLLICGIFLLYLIFHSTSFISIT